MDDNRLTRLQKQINLLKTILSQANDVAALALDSATDTNSVPLFESADILKGSLSIHDRMRQVQNITAGAIFSVQMQMALK